VRRILDRLALVLVGLVLGLALAEGAVRWLTPQPFVTGDLRWENHPTLGFRLEPNCDIPGELGGHINNLGLRGDDLGAKADDVWRVLIVGDSFTYGAGVPLAAAFPTRLQDRLGERTDVVAGKRVQVVNAGTVGYGTRREMAWLEAYGEQTEPDEVVLAFFTGNDFSDNNSDLIPTIIDGQRVRGDPGETETSLRMRILRNESHLYRWWRRIQYDGPGQVRPKDVQNRPLAVDRGLGKRIALYAQKDKAPPHVIDSVEAGYAVTQTALDDVLAWCTARQLPLKLLIIPDILQVDGEPVKRVVETFPALDGKVDPTRPQKEVVGWCSRNGVPVLDLLGPLRTESKTRGESLHLGYDPHWNEAGHDFAAQLMAETFWP
jgi:hypothetical protein